MSTPTLYAIAAQREQSGIEVGHLASVRLATAGMRAITTVPFRVVARHLQQTQANPSPKSVVDFFAVGPPEAVASFVQQHASTIYHFTAGVGDAVYLPAGWMFLEKVQGSDCIGVRLAFVSPQDTAEIEGAKDLYISMCKPNSNVQAVADCLAKR